MSAKTTNRLDRIERATIGDDWRRFVGAPDSDWPEGAQDARVAEHLLGRPVPNVEALSDEDLERVIAMLKAKIDESELEI